VRVLYDTTGKADAELEVPIPRGGKIIGRVTDADGKPIPDSHVGRGTSGSYFSSNALYQACSADGQFEYDGVNPDAPIGLEAAAPGYQTESKENLTPPAPGKPIEVNFKLRKNPGAIPDPAAPAEERRRTVSGTVRDPDEKPVAGVLIVWGYQLHSESVQTRTDAKGNFRLIVPEKADALAVLPREYPPQFPRVEADIDRDIEVRLIAGHTARGRVTDGQGKPIRDVRVTPVIGSPIPGIANPYWLSEAEASSDADGRFEVRGVPAPASFDFLKAGLDALRHQSLKLDGPDNPVWMTHVGAVAGKVVDQAGKPIRSFRVLVNFPLNRLPDDQVQGYFAGYSGIGVRFTSDDGAFLLTGVGAGSVYRLTVQSEGYCGASVDRVLARPANLVIGSDDAIFRLGPPASFRVRAASEGKPVAGARVTLVNGEPGLDLNMAWGPYGASWAEKVRGRTDSNGLADFPAIQFDAATVLIEAPGFARRRVGWRNGSKELAVELVAEAVIAGEVRDRNGDPIKTCYLNLSSAGDNIPGSIGPDDNGKFRITQLPSGSWTVLIRSGDGRTTIYRGQLTLKAGETKDMVIDAKSP
jgi:hypothetical protein